MSPIRSCPLMTILQRQFQSRKPKSILRRYTSTLTVDPARTYCLDLLRKHDKPSHLLTAFSPPHARDANLAIRAFNIDTARIADQVSNVSVGRMRMQWWKEAISKAYEGRPPNEPVAVLLAHALAGGARLTKGFWGRVVACREQYLGNVPFATVGALEAYAEGTYSSLHYLSLEAVGRQSAALDHVASHIGKAAGIAAVLRGMPVLATASGGGAVVLPLDACAELGMRQEDVLRVGGAADGVKDVVFRVATLANDHLITARKMLGEAGAEGMGVAFGTFMHAVPTAVYLERLEKADFDPFDPRLQRVAWQLPWRAYRAYSTKKF